MQTSDFGIGQSSLVDPLLDQRLDRRTIFPIKHTDIWRMYKQHEAGIWHAHEVKLDDDLNDYQALTPDEKQFLNHVLAFFASSDMIVSENLAKRFIAEVTIPEARFFYSFQNMIENIHSETYSKMIEAYIHDEEEKENLFNAVDSMPFISKKAKWAEYWISSESSFATRLVAFAIVEGIFFSGSFCAIYWMNERGKMPGLSKANDFIARDEALHTEFAILLYREYIVNKLTKEELLTVLTEAVELEIEFITEAIPCKLLGMNADQMIQYIKYCAVRLASQLGYDVTKSDNSDFTTEEYFADVKQPFAFMDRICLRDKSNFFENEVSAYRKFDNENLHDDEDTYEGIEGL